MQSDDSRLKETVSACEEEKGVRDEEVEGIYAFP